MRRTLEFKSRFITWKHRAETSAHCWRSDQKTGLEFETMMAEEKHQLLADEEEVWGILCSSGGGADLDTRLAFITRTVLLLESEGLRAVQSLQSAESAGCWSQVKALFRLSELAAHKAAAHTGASVVNENHAVAKIFRTSLKSVRHSWTEGRMEWRAVKEITADENITLTDGARRHIYNTEPKATLRPRVTELLTTTGGEQREVAAVRKDKRWWSRWPRPGGEVKRSTVPQKMWRCVMGHRRSFTVNLSDWIRREAAAPPTRSSRSSRSSQSVLKPINLHTQTLSRLFSFIYLFILHFVCVSYFLLKLLNNVRFGLNF